MYIHIYVYIYINMNHIVAAPSTDLSADASVNFKEPCSCDNMLHDHSTLRLREPTWKRDKGRDSCFSHLGYCIGEAIIQ